MTLQNKPADKKKKNQNEKKKTKPLSVTAYAAHRNVSRRAVYDALNSGRINPIDPKIRPLRIDPAKADREWDAFTQEEHRGDVWKESPPPAPSAPTAPPRDHDGDDDDFDETQDITKENAFKHMQYAKAKRETWLAKTAELEFQEAAGKLISADETKTAWMKIITTSKTKMLSVPSKVRSRLPHLTIDDVATIEEAIREALEDLAHEGN